MSKKDEFKDFVKRNPSLINYVHSGQKTWQQLYEIYDLFGEEETKWNNYLKTDNSSDLLSFIKNINIDNIKEGLNSFQKAITLLSNLTNKSSDEPKTEEYKPRPLYKHFED